MGRCRYRHGVFHLRVIVPSGRTDAVLDVLREQVGVAHVVLLRDVAVEPPGDVVEAAVAREAADDVVAALCRLDVDHVGGITLEAVDTMLSDAADRAEEAAPGDGADAMVWEELLAKTGEEAKPSVTFQSFLTLACVLASVGVVTNSPITIVGAMIVGPEFGPLAAIAVGLVRRRPDLLRRAGLALGIGFPLAMVITAGVTVLAEWAGLFDRDTVLAAHQVEFVYQVGPYSLIVALLAGAAGMLAMTSAKSAALVGVFVSVTTVPAAGYAVVAAVLGEWDRCAGSVAQLVVNMIGIVLAAAGVLLVSRRRVGHDRPLSEG